MSGTIGSFLPTNLGEKVPKKHRPLKARPAYYLPILVDTLEGMLRDAVKADMMDPATLEPVIKRVRAYCWMPPFGPADPFKYASRV